jgi:hypothetical protein
LAPEIVRLIRAEQKRQNRRKAYGRFAGATDPFRWR